MWNLPKLSDRGVDSWEGISVVVKCSLINFFNAAVFRSSAVIFRGILEQYNCTREEASWPGSLATSMCFLATIVSGPLCQRYSPRPVLMLGSIISSTGMISSYFAPSIATLNVTFGIIYGIGSGFILHSMVLFVQQYFHKYKSYAIGVSSFGSSFAGLVFPRVMETLQDFYNFKSSLLIMGSILIHIFVIALTQHEAWWLKKSNTHLVQENTVIKHQGPRVSLVKSLSVLQKPVFYIMTVSFATFLFSNDCFFSTMVDFSIDKGFSKHDAVSVIQMFALSDMLGRVFLSNLPSIIGFDNRFMIIICFVAMASSLWVLPTVSSLLMLSVVTMVYSTGIGIIVILHNVSMGHYIGNSRLPMAYSISGGFHGTITLTRPLFVGHFRDHVGSYEMMFKINGILLVFSALLWSTQFICSRCKRKEEIKTITTIYKESL